MVRFEDAGRSRDSVMDALSQMQEGDIDWRGGRAPIFVFSAGDAVRDLGRDAFNAFFSENALGARRAFPSLLRMEQEVVAMGLDLFHATDGGVGNMTSGGTESIVMAVKAARDFHRRRRADPRLRGNIVAAITVHPAFEKAAALMDLEIRHVPVTQALVADPAAMEARLDADTIMMVGSAPSFSYGVIDPIEALAAAARRHGIWLHVDACVGGWLAPFVRDIGYPIPKFDFEVDGVMSMSADLHKFGFCPKPASTVFYRDAERQACQGFSFDSWPSGAFATQTLVGTRPGGAVAGAWAVLNHLGRDGYRAIARDHMIMREAYFEGLRRIPGLNIRGAPALMNIAFGCDDVDMARVATLIAERGWLPGVVRTPPSLHLMLSMQHEAARAAYIGDVADCVAALRAGRAAQAARAAYS